MELVLKLMDLSQPNLDLELRLELQHPTSLPFVVTDNYQVIAVVETRARLPTHSAVHKQAFNINQSVTVSIDHSTRSSTYRKVKRAVIARSW